MLARGLIPTIGILGALVCLPAHGLAITPLLVKLQQQAEAGNHEAEVKLGLALAATKDEASEVTAIGWFRKAYVQGDPDGAWYLGNAYATGIGVAKNLTNARRWMRLGIDGSGNRMVAYALQLPDLDRGTAQNGETARAHWLRRAATTGSTIGMALLAEDEMDGSHGVRRDSADAEEWLIRAANGGSVNAEVLLGDGLIRGMFGTADADQGLRWLRNAAESGSGQATGLMALYLMTGSAEVPKNLPEGLKWATRAAQQHNAFGYVLLGQVEQQGTGGKPADPAAALYDFAAAQRTDTAHSLPELAHHISVAEASLSHAQISQILARVAEIPIPKDGDSITFKVKTVPPGWPQ
jgi:TPR repeat protein